MGEWKAHKLGTLGSFIGGVSTISRSDYGYGTPFITYKNIYRNSKIDVFQLELMNVSQQELDRRSCIYGDIFFTASSETPEEVALSSVLLDKVENLTFNGFSKRLRLHNFNTLKPEFARYYLRSPYFRACMYERMTGDIRYNISNSGLGGVIVYLPKISTQIRIADILSTYDDAIENNNRRITLLEKAARELYCEWFVRFRFPGHEEAEFVNGLPKGWEVVPLGDMVNITSSKRSYDRERVDAGIPLYRSKEIIQLENGEEITEPLFISIGWFEKIRERFGAPQENDILITSRGTIGVSFLVDKRVFYFSDGNLTWLQSGKTPELALFVYLWLGSPIGQATIQAVAIGTSQKALPIENLKRIKLIKPNSEIISAFFDVAMSFIEQKRILQTQSQNLARQRDLLLPRLMSGKLDAFSAFC
jgi:type I restriction enzyme S subunit